MKIGLPPIPSRLGLFFFAWLRHEMRFRGLLREFPEFKELLRKWPFYFERILLLGSQASESYCFALFLGLGCQRCPVMMMQGVDLRGPEGEKGPAPFAPSASHPIGCFLKWRCNPLLPRPWCRWLSCSRQSVAIMWAPRRPCRVSCTPC